MFMQSNMTDHEFSEWLRKQDENWTFENVLTIAGPPITDYFANGERVAYAIYDNRGCTRQFFIK